MNLGKINQNLFQDVKGIIYNKYINANFTLYDEVVLSRIYNISYFRFYC